MNRTLIAAIFALTLCTTAQAQNSNNFETGNNEFLLDCGNNRAELARLKAEIKQQRSGIAGDTLAIPDVPKQQVVEEQPKPVNEVTVEQPAVAEAPEAPSVLKEKDLRGFSIRTNLLYWLATVPNIGVEYRPSNAVGILVNGGWNHWIWKDQYAHDRTFFVQPEVRWYLGKTKQWFVGMEGHIGQFNFKFGEDDGRQGDFRGAGLTGGYRLQLSRYFDMDFSLGLGYTNLKYETYTRTGSVFVRKEGNLAKNVFFPAQAGVSLIYKFK
jgi:hypothetical protein